MMHSGLLAVAAIVLAAAAGFVLVPAAGVWLGATVSGISMRARMRASTDSSLPSGLPRGGRVGAARWLKAARTVMLEGGFPPTSRPARLLLSVPAARRGLARAAAGLERTGVRATPETLAQTLLLVVPAAFVAGLALTGSVFLAALIVTALAVWARIAAGKAGVRGDDEIMALLPDALRALGIYYGSGMTMLQAFEQVAAETPDPLGPQLALVAMDMKAGRSADEALGAMRSRLRIPSVAFVSIVLEVHHRTGGSIQPLLDRAARSITRTLSLRKSLRVKTAQSRLSARIVSIMPFAIFLALAAINPSYAASFFSSGAGVALFCVACGLEVAGIVLVRKILAVDLR